MVSVSLYQRCSSCYIMQTVSNKSYFICFILFALCISVGERQSNQHGVCYPQASKAKLESEKPDSFQRYAANVGTARVLDADLFNHADCLKKSLSAYLLRCISHGRFFLVIQYQLIFFLSMGIWWCRVDLMHICFNEFIEYMTTLFFKYQDWL